MEPISTICRTRRELATVAGSDAAAQFVLDTRVDQQLAHDELMCIY